MLQSVCIYSNILHIVLYGCETSSLNLRDKDRLRAFDDKVLRGIFILRREEITGAAS
jgi:hypothetical protein